MKTLDISFKVMRTRRSWRSGVPSLRMEHGNALSGFSGMVV
jgi:hypothetical protein